MARRSSAARANREVCFTSPSAWASAQPGEQAERLGGFLGCEDVQLISRGTVRT